MDNESEVLDQDENDPVEESEADVDESSEQTEEESEKEPEAEPAKRPVFTMPVSKAQEEKRRAVEKAKEEAQKEAETAMQQLKAEYESKLREASPGAYEKELERVATENGLDVKAAADLLDVFKKSINMPDLSKYDKIVKDQEIDAIKAGVSREFDENVLHLIKEDYPGVTDAHIQRIKDEVSELAFSEGYNTYKIADIYKVNKGQFEFKNKMSAEGSGGRSSEIVEFRKLSDAEEIKLADSDSSTYKKYLGWLSGQESKFID